MDTPADALSRGERQRLRDIEGSLVRDDPDFVAAFADIESLTDPAIRSGSKWVNWLSVGGALGTLVLAAGLILGLPLLGVLGFVAVVAATSRLVQDDRIVNAVRSLVRPSVEDPSPPT